ncbi:Peptidase A2 domain-containing protein [Trichostrongylus colubriformis]|uniref:Peptidase A2 domain-containing protein n=1 Tax=Trichostrongylus colubriformis TaxID=6319 RepID=A0AAN8FN87_TRICO
MTSALSTSQRLLTRASNRHKRLLADNSDLLQADLHFSIDNDVQRRQTGELRRKLRRATAAIKAATSKVEEALYKYSNTADQLDENTPSISELAQQITENSEAAQALLDQANAVLTTMMQLQADIDSCEEFKEAEVLDLKLAPIPIPKFNGDIWEWETFWKSFERNVHSRRMDEMYKFSYLLEALEGEAKEAVKQFQVSGSTYPLVIAHLQEKYGNVQTLVDRLLSRLQAARAKSNRLEDQLTFCDQLTSIRSQLQLKGEHTDNTFLQKQLLCKFSSDVQRHILAQKNKCYANGTWNTKTLLTERNIWRTN